MLILISPAKKLGDQISAGHDHLEASTPVFLEHAGALMKILKAYTPKQIGKLMKLSPALSELNHKRYQSFHMPFTRENAKRALFMFQGDVYTGLNAGTLSEAQIMSANAQLRILSGLYGMLRPLDLIQPYRLEMGTSLKTKRGKNLYEFWGDLITEHINETLKDHKVPTVINLASDEYFKAVRPKQVKGRIITPTFKERKGNAYRIIMPYVKKARGLMVRYILDHDIQEPEKLKFFNTEGYHFTPDLSTETSWVFTRGECGEKIGWTL